MSDKYVIKIVHRGKRVRLFLNMSNYLLIPAGLLPLEFLMVHFI